MITLRTVLLAAGLAFLVAGCGGTSYDYSSANDTKPGPGLLSGEDGVVNIVRAKPNPPVVEETAEEQGEPAKQVESLKSE